MSVLSTILSVCALVIRHHIFATHLALYLILFEFDASPSRFRSRSEPSIPQHVHVVTLTQRIGHSHGT
jgi:hypothetical protein